jgi:hypothetical protein
MWTKKFWKDAAERAVKTAAQFGMGAWGVTMFTTVGDVVPVAEATGLAMLFGAGLSILTSLGSSVVGDRQSASLLRDGDL